MSRGRNPTVRPELVEGRQCLRSPAALHAPRRPGVSSRFTRILDLVELTSGAAVARRHPWEQVRFAFFSGVLRRAGLPGRGARVLDVGSGDAWFAGRLAAETGAELVCWDTGYAEAAPPEAAPGVRFTAQAPEGRFPLVLALDVLEHVPDDRSFITSLVAGRLAAGGDVLVSVPAWPALFSRHDRALRHVRRYTPASARALLEAAGLRVVTSGGLFHSLLAARAAQKAVERWTRGPARLAGAWSAPGWATDVVEAALGADARASAIFSRLGWELPGLSWWALCRGP